MTTKKNPAAVSLGRLGGQAKSKIKTTAARANGAKGGRPALRFEAQALGLCFSKGASAEEAIAKCERKAQRLMSNIKSTGQLPQISVIEIKLIS